MTPRCRICGKFIASSQIAAHKAKFFYIPLSEFSEERCEWECTKCIAEQTPKAKEALEND